MSKFSIRMLLMVAAGSFPTLAMAHTGHGEVSGFVQGFAHPMGGLDHILAMVMVGILAAQLGGRALWLVPASFVVVMALGGGLGFLVPGLPLIELGIALSIVVLGAAVAFNLTAPVPAVMALVGFFAVFHGAAHGAEMPETVGGLAYGAGFVVATALLHVVGLACGLLLGLGYAAKGTALVRSLGGAASLAGVGFLTGII